MLKFWIIVLYIEDASAMDGEYPTVQENKIYTDRNNAIDDFDRAILHKSSNTIRIELVECISNKTIQLWPSAA